MAFSFEPNWQVCAFLRYCLFRFHCTMLIKYLIYDTCMKTIFYTSLCQCHQHYCNTIVVRPYTTRSALSAVLSLTACRFFFFSLPLPRRSVFICVYLFVRLLTRLLKTDSIFIKYYEMVGHNPGTNRLDFE